MEGILEFLLLVGKLKRLKRTGRVLSGIPEAESVADHSFRAAIIAMLLSDLLIARGERVDAEKAMRMALLHDVLEAIVSDIPAPAIREGLVSVNELEAYKKAFESLPEELKEKYVRLAREFLEQKTIEAKIAKAADKLDQIVQALEYSKIFSIDLSRFAMAEVPLGEEIQKSVLERMLHGSRIRPDRSRARLLGHRRNEAL